MEDIFAQTEEESQHYQQSNESNGIILLVNVY